MSERPQFIIDYIAAYEAANPTLPRPEFEGPNAGGWYYLITGGRGISYQTRVRCGAIKRMTKVLQDRVKEESNA